MENKLKNVKSCETVESLGALGIGELVYDIGCRGGSLGFYGSDVAEFAGCSESDLPGKYGCYCNYLGGGVRGAVVASGYSGKVGAKAAKLLDAIAEACKTAYVNAENGLNDEVYEDGDINWDALATQSARKSGMVSAY
ncbi:MAG: hypothetical protein HQ579_02770 [Candidatus Omnitrophica bacterium]|nr:hypothetical protein [Candidatus Omnitrophota bacterium]